MKTYKLACAWGMYGIIKIKANSLEEAMKKASAEITPLPEGHYLDDSFQLDLDSIADLYPKEAAKW